MIDSHCHLTYKGLREEMDAVVGRARAAGVTGFITVGVDPADSVAAVEAARKYPDVWATVGCHPHDASEMTDRALSDMAALAKDPKVVAWGEAGLDFFRDLSPREAQRKWFRAQAATARELGLPLVVHDRDAHGETLEIISAEAKKGLRGVMHCFSGDLDFAQKVLKTGFYLSIPGTVTYPKNETLKTVVAGVPLERCLIETDCPFLSPQPVRSKKNEPAYLGYVAEEIARIRGLSAEDVKRITARAARELFGLDEVGGAGGAEKIAYPIRRSLYVNVTDRCSNRCAFCAKNRSSVVKGHDLTLGREPSVDEMVAAVESQGGPAAWDEVVFCGFGEPLTRLGPVLGAAREFKLRGAKRIRVNTDGLASLLHGEDVPPLLADVVDAVSVSLNAPDAETYERVCRPTLPGAYEAVKKFIAGCVGTIPDVTASVVALPGLNLNACEKVAVSLGAKFRVRPYDEVG